MVKSDLIKQECAICGNNAPFEVLYPANFKAAQIDEDIFSARRIPDCCHYRLVRCLKCGLIYSNPILEEEKIKELYKRSKLTYEPEIKNLKKTYGDYLKKVIRVIPGKGNLLEIGCGNGFFLQEALKQGFKKVWGVEPSLSAVEKAPKRIKQNIKNEIFHQGLFKNNFFDVICFFQTLDHIVDPNKFLKTCYEVLKEKGVIFCIVHDTDSLSARLMGEKTPIFDIEHTFLYNKKTLRQIFEKNNFENIEELDIANEYSLRYWISLFPLGEHLKAFFTKSLTFFHLQDKSIKIKVGNIGIVAQKPKK